jgi:SAM-dependent methyltransferase
LQEDDDMPDVYATITQVEPEVQERLVDVLEMRASDPRQRAMWEAYLSEIDFPAAAKVLEIGCGTGAVSRVLAQWPGVAQVLGVDPSPVFIAKARALAQDIPNLSFKESDGRSLALDAASFDVVVVHQAYPMSRSPHNCSQKLFASCSQVAGWPCSMATTRPQRWRRGSAIHWRYVPMPFG